MANIVSPQSLAIHVLTRQGLELALRIASSFEHTHIYCIQTLRDYAPLYSSRKPQIIWFTGFMEHMANVFNAYFCHICVTACGIAVRAIAPHLGSKTADPAVLVVDQGGKHVISLLSGHIGGANRMTLRVAQALGASPVITTATDCEGLPAIDEEAIRKGLYIVNIDAAKTISSALLAGKHVQLHDPGNWLEIAQSLPGILFLRCSSVPDMEKVCRSSDTGIWVTERYLPAQIAHKARWLILQPRSIFVGIGCRRGTPKEAIISAVHTCFYSSGVSLRSMACLASLDAKADEIGLLEAARFWDVPIKFFPAADLAAFPVTVSSHKACERFGINGVCEPAALAAASGGSGEGYVLLQPKRILHNTTVALAQRSFPLKQNKS